MYKINIRISPDRTVTASEAVSGITGENNVTRLCFEVPEEYAGYNKFLDIEYKNGSKTQTVLDTGGRTEFEYDIPIELTSDFSVDMQLVMKSGKIIFKSKFFTLTFDESINATQRLESDYTDSIETLFETKADKSECLRILRITDTLLPTSVYNADMENVNEALSSKADMSDLPEKISDLTNDNHTVTDAAYVHTDNNFTSSEKEKLSGIAEGAEVNVQSDWNQSDSSADDYIKNKPSVYTKGEVDSAVSSVRNIVDTIYKKDSYSVTPVETVIDYPFVTGHKYEISTTVTINGVKIKNSSGTDMTSLGNVSANGKTTYTAAEGAAKIRSYPQGSGTITVTDTSAELPAVKKSLNDAESDIDALETGVSGLRADLNTVYHAEKFTLAKYTNSFDYSFVKGRKYKIVSTVGATVARVYASEAAVGTSNYVKNIGALTANTELSFTMPSTGDDGIILYVYANGAGTVTLTDLSTLIESKVDKVSGKGLSTEDYTTAEKTKLSGIAEGAEVNVQADWNQSSSSADDYIKNKPAVFAVENSFKNKTMTVLGDSICHGAFTNQHPWYNIVKNRYGLASVTDLAADGKCYSKDGTGTNYRITKIVEDIDTDNKPDIIAVFAGTNDFAFNVPLGNIPDPADGTDNADFCPAVKYTMEYLLTNFPDAKIIFITPLQRKYLTESYNAVNSAGHYLFEYVNAIRELAGIYGVILCDLFRDSEFHVFNPDFKETYTKNISYPDGDGLHPNQSGTELYTKNGIIPTFDRVLLGINEAVKDVLKDPEV